MLLGCDPGSVTGLAVVEAGRLIYCKQFRKPYALDKAVELIKHYGIKVVAVEQPKLGIMYDKTWAKAATKVPFERFGVQSGGRISLEDYRRMTEAAGPAGASGMTAGQIKIVQNVGMNIEWTNRMAFTFEQLGCNVIRSEPKRDRSKWQVGYWTRVFDWALRVPGEHARDAAIIAYLNENRVNRFKDREAV